MPFINIPAEQTIYIDRESDKELAQLIVGNLATIIEVNGKLAVGKSTLVSQFLRQQKDTILRDYELIAWINCSSVISTKTGIVTIAQEIESAHHLKCHENDIVEAIKFLQEYCKKTDKWLLVFDQLNENMIAETLEVLTSFISNGKIIYTVINSLIGKFPILNEAKKVEVKSFNIDMTKALAEKYLPPTEKFGDFSEFCQITQGLPGVIIGLCQLFNDSLMETNFAKFWQNLKNNGFEEIMGFQLLEKNVQKSLRQIENEAKESSLAKGALSIIQQAAYLGSYPIPFEFFINEANKTDSNTIVWLWEARTKLTFITFEKSGNLTIMKQFQQMLQEFYRNKKINILQILLLRLRTVFNYLTTNDHKKSPEDLVPYVPSVHYVLFEIIQQLADTEQNQLAQDQIIELWSSLGRFYYLYYGELQSSLVCFNKGKLRLEKLLGQELIERYQISPTRFKLTDQLSPEQTYLLRLYAREFLSQLGAILSQLIERHKNNLEAIIYSKNAYRILRNLPDSEPVSVAYTLRNLTRALRKQSYLAKEKEYYDQLEGWINTHEKDFKSELMKAQLLLDKGINQKEVEDSKLNDKDRNYQSAITFMLAIREIYQKYNQDDRSFALLNFSQEQISLLKEHIKETTLEGNKLDERLVQKIQAISLKNSDWAKVKFKPDEVKRLRGFLDEKGKGDLSAKLLDKKNNRDLALLLIYLGETYIANSQVTKKSEEFAKGVAYLFQALYHLQSSDTSLKNLLTRAYFDLAKVFFENQYYALAKIYVDKTLPLQRETYQILDNNEKHSYVKATELLQLNIENEFNNSNKKYSSNTLLDKKFASIEQISEYYKQEWEPKLITESKEETLVNLDLLQQVNEILFNAFNLFIQQTAIRSEIDKSLSIVHKLQARDFNDNRFLMEILGFTLAKSRLLRDNTDESIISQIVEFIITKYLDKKSITIKEELKKEMKIFLKTISINLNQLRQRDIPQSNDFKKYFEDNFLYYKEVMIKVFELSIKMLGELPNFEYCIICMGSLATSLTTLYSDINLLILVNTITDDIKSYFKKFIKLTELIIIACGETPMWSASVFLEFLKFASDKRLNIGLRLNNGSPIVIQNEVIGILNTPKMLLSKLDISIVPSSELKNILTALLITRTLFESGKEQLHTTYRKELFDFLVNNNKSLTLLITLMKHLNSHYDQLCVNLNADQQNTKEINKINLKSLLIYLTEAAKLIALFLIRTNQKDHNLPRNFWECMDVLRYNPNEIDAKLYERWTELFAELMKLRLQHQKDHKSDLVELAYAEINKIQINGQNVYAILVQIKEKMEDMIKKINSETSLQNFKHNAVLDVPYTVEISKFSLPSKSNISVKSSINIPAKSLEGIPAIKGEQTKSGHQPTLEDKPEINEALNLCMQPGEDGPTTAVEKIKKLHSHKQFKQIINEALFMAARSGQRKVVKGLLDSKLITVKAQDNLGNTLLHIAAENDDKKLFNRYKNKIDINIKNKDEQTSLHVAILNNKQGLLETLIKLNLSCTARAKFPDVNAESKDGALLTEMPPLHYAVYTGYQEIVGILLSSKKITADHLTVTVAGKGNLMHLAVLSGSPKMVQYLLQHEIFFKDFQNLLHLPNEAYFSPLGMAAYCGYTDIIRVLINVDRKLLKPRDSNSIPLLHCAVYACSHAALVEVVKYLQEYPEALGDNLNRRYAFKQLPNLEQFGVTAENETLSVQDLVGKFSKGLLGLPTPRTIVQQKNIAELDAMEGFFANLTLAAEGITFNDEADMTAIRDLVSDSEKETIKTRYQNLVLQGGGPKGIAYVGAIKGLEICMGEGLPDMQRIAGTSAGAITALALALGLTSEEIQEELSTKKISEFVENSFDPKEIRAVAEKPSLRRTLKIARDILHKNFHSRYASESALKATFHTLTNTFYMKGLCEGNNFLNWLEYIIQKYTGIPYLTFGELHALVQQSPVQHEVCKGFDVVATVPNEEGLTPNQYLLVKGKQHWELLYINHQKQRITIEIERVKGLCEALKALPKKDAKDLSEDKKKPIKEIITSYYNDTLGKKRFYKDLYVVATQLLPTPNSRIINSENSTKEEADLIISDAIRASMSIPGVFIPHCLHFKRKEQRCVEASNSYVDGGLLFNFPIQLFDNVQFHPFGFGQSNTASFQLPNRQTLGLSLFTPPDPNAEPPEIHIKSLPKLLKSIGAVYNNAEAIYANIQRPIDKSRTIKISNLGVSLFEFDISPEMQAKLIQEGYQRIKGFSPEFRAAIEKSEKSSAPAKEKKVESAEEVSSDTEKDSKHEPSVTEEGYRREAFFGSGKKKFKRKLVEALKTSKEEEEEEDDEKEIMKDQPTVFKAKH